MMKKTSAYTSMTKRIWTVISSFVIIMGLVGALLPTLVRAEEKRTVKVAFFPMEGYHIVEADGSYGGMDVEYLEVLSEYTDWQVEYVSCDSWEDALEKLEAKQVDLVGSAQYSSERAEIFDYADLASGYTYGVIATNSDSNIAYEDFEAMHDITFGMVKNYVRQAEFFEYLTHNDITSPKVKEYETTQKLLEALDAGEIDAFVHTFMETKEGMRLVGRFAPRPTYYITYKGNDVLLNELNQAIADVRMSYPELEADLMNQFYESRWDKTVLFTSDEKRYIEEKGSLTVGYLDGYYPFSYEKEDFKGLAKEALEEGLSVTGLELEYQKMDSQQAAEEALSLGTIDLLAYAVDVESVQENRNLVELEAYAQIPLVLVVEKDKSYEEIKVLATVPEFVKQAESVVDMEITEIAIEATAERCLKVSFPFPAPCQ